MDTTSLVLVKTIVYFYTLYVQAVKASASQHGETFATVLPARSDSDVMSCLQSYQGLIINRSLVDRINTQVIYRFV